MVDKPAWFSDIAIISHMTSDAGKLNNLKSYINNDGNSEILQITHVGDATNYY